MNNINETVGYDRAIEMGYVGFANFYLGMIKNQEKEPDVEVYKQLLDIDQKLGTLNSEQLYLCLQNITRSDIIKISLEVSFKLNVIYFNYFILSFLI